MTTKIVNMPLDIVRIHIHDIEMHVDKSNYDSAYQLAKELTKYLRKTAEKARKLELEQSLREAINSDNRVAIMV